MEIRRMLRGENVRPAAARPAQSGEKEKPAVRSSADRLELSCQWAENMEKQRAQAQAALLSGAKEKKQSNTILDMLDGPDSEELKAETDQLKVRRRCMEISRRIMAGKKVPPQDERYLMLNDPDGYKLAMAMRTPKRNPKKWKSVLEEEDKDAGSRQTAEADGEAASCEEAGESAGSGEGGGTAGESQ